MSRRRSRELMAGFWEEFKDGAAARGVPESVAQRVFTQVIAFSEFGFPKSHAAAFGLLAYQSAWLRHYHPVEYYCALFNNQPMGFYSLDVLGRDAQRNGIEIRLPDVNRSDVWCTIERETGNGKRETGAVRVGLGFVRDWSEETATAVVTERERNGPFRSVGELVRRAPPKLKRSAIENLVWVGGCDGFGLTRRELLWQIGLWLPPREERGGDARGSAWRSSSSGWPLTANPNTAYSASIRSPGSRSPKRKCSWGWLSASSSWRRPRASPPRAL